MKFSIVQNGGYKVQEVDSFIRKIKKMETAGWTSRSSVKLQSVRFTLTKAKGYKTSEVDDYLDSLLTQKSNQLGLETKGNNPVLTGFPSPNIDAPLSPAITSARLRDLTPPVVDGIGYRKEEVDRFFNLVADSLQIFEESSIEEQKIHDLPFDVLAHHLVGLTKQLGDVSVDIAFKMIKQSYSFRNLTATDGDIYSTIVE